jgi:hypothetical protein
MEKIVKLFDWIVTEKSVRGSRQDDNGLWVNNNLKPLYFCPINRVVEVDSGQRFLLTKETICKALGLDEKSNKFLNGLPTKP